MKKNFMDIQLFAEGDPGVTPPVTPPITPPVTPPVEPTPEPVKTVSKELFDKNASELAQIKKDLKALQDKGKTEEQIKADTIAEKEALIAEKENLLKEATKKLNNATALSLIAEAKNKIALQNKNVDIDKLVGAFVTDSEEDVKTNASALNSLLIAAYEKGASDTKNGIIKGGSKDITVGVDIETNDFINYQKSKTNLSKEVKLK